MAENHWQQARLIPTSGINGQDEAERRATSALLAVMGAVREFGAAIVRPFGAPAGTLETFIEVPFKLDDRTVIPDGLLRTARGGKSWTALVEVKTGASDLERAQVEAYLDVAREGAFDAVLTISNQLAPAPGVHPVEVDRRKIKRVGLHHLSWAEVLTIAVQQRVHRGVSDPEQAWILGELIRYLEHPRSGALDFSDMGASWVTVREALAAGTLRANDKGLAEVVSRWDQLVRFAALRLGRELGAEVQLVVSRKEQAEPASRIAAQAQSLVASGVLTGSLRIPDAIAPIDVQADLRASRVTISVDVDAPRDGRAATRINWLIRQLKEAPDGLRIDAWVLNARTSTSALLKHVREDPGVLIADPKKDLRVFRVAAQSPMGTKRGAGRGGFVDSVLAAIDGFYGSAVQNLRPWAAKAPQLPRGGRTAAEEAGVDITPPPRDLLEPDVSASLGTSDDEMSGGPNHVVRFAAQDAVEVVPAVEEAAEERTSEAMVEADDLVSWDAAHDRLDRERSDESAEQDGQRDESVPRRPDSNDSQQGDPSVAPPRRMAEPFG